MKNLKKSFLLYSAILILNMPLFLFSQDTYEWQRTNFNKLDGSTTNLINIDGLLYTSGSQGVWLKDSIVDKWEKISDLTQVNGIVKYRSKYYCSSWLYGINQSDNLSEWNIVDSTLSIPSYSIDTDGQLLFGSTQNGLFRLDNESNKWVKENLVNKCIHNQIISKVIITESDIFAFGCEYIYTRKKDNSEWRVLDFFYNRCAITAEYIDGIVYFSTSGEGLFQFNPYDYKVTKSNSVLQEELLHVNSIYKFNDKIYYIFLKNLNEDRGSKNNIADDQLHDIIFYKDALYVSTEMEGIWKTITPENRTLDKFQLIVFPSPSDGIINYCISNPLESEYTLSIVNTSGQIISDMKVNVNKDEFSSCFKSEIKIAGDYFLICNSAENRYIKKFTIIK